MVLEHINFAAAAGRISALYSEEDDALLLAMLGQEYTVRHSGITLRGHKAPENHERIIIDYVSSAGTVFVPLPWKSLQEASGRAMPNFRERVELILAQHSADCIQRASTILPLLDAQACRSMIGSDLAFTVSALPKVHVHVELSRESQEFPPEAWILFSHNAAEFLSAEGLFLLGEVFKDRLLSLLRIY